MGDNMVSLYIANRSWRSGIDDQELGGDCPCLLVPYPANFLKNKASAFVRMCRNNPCDSGDILHGD